jgi:hypothetical protein
MAMKKLYFDFKLFFYLLGIFLFAFGGFYLFYGLYNLSDSERGFVEIFRDLTQPEALIFGGGGLLMIIVSAFSKVKDQSIDEDIDEDLVKLSKFGAEILIDVGVILVLAVIGFWIFKYINPIIFSILIIGIGLIIMGALTLNAHESIIR